MEDLNSQNCYCCGYSLANTGSKIGECPECTRQYNFIQRGYAKEAPDLYATKVKLISGEFSSVLSAAEQSISEKIVAVFGGWAVTTNGIECLSHGYQIAGHRLHETNWEEHLRQKSWVVIGDFIQAFEMAKTRYEQEPA